MDDGLEEHDGMVSIGETRSTSLPFADDVAALAEKVCHRKTRSTGLPFADDVDALAEKEQEQEDLVGSLSKSCTIHKMGIRA